MRPRSALRAIRRAIHVVAASAPVATCLVVSGAVAFSTATNAASSGTVVGATVTSATNLGTAGCLPGVAARTEFGTVLAGTAARTTDDCTISFGSSNDTASLRIGQRDGVGMAMAGAPDRLMQSWGTNGVSTLASGVGGLNDPGGNSSVLQPDGKLVVVGGSNLASNYRSVVYRRNADGTLDTAGFNAPNGYLLFDAAPAADEELLGLALQSDGTIIVVGRARTGGTDWNATIAKVRADGTLETSFGGGGTGWRVVDLGGPGSNESYQDVEVETSGSMVAVGTADPAGGDDSWVLDRFDAAGVPDPTTGGGTGRVVINPTANSDRIETIAAHPEGGFLLGGRAQPVTFRGEVRRVDAALAPVTSWGVSGVRAIDIVSYYENVIEIEPRPDGSARLGIEHTGGFDQWAIVASLTPSGALDTAGFNAPDGFTKVQDIGTTDSLRSIEVTPDGSVYALFVEGGTRYRVGRLRADGTVDTSFGASGVTSLMNNTVPGRRSLHMDGNSLVVMTRNGATTSDSMIRFGGPEVDDYLNTGGAGDRDWLSGTSTSTFGVCVRQQLVATPDWLVDADNDCTIDDADAWRSIPATTAVAGAKVAHTTVSGQTGTTSLRFGFRPATNLPAGRYEAPLAIEVIAPQA